jgi:alanine racemase
MTDFDPPLRLHLSGDALVANWRFLQRQGRAACGAAVKANGYGLGARDVVSRLRDAGCRDFFVAHWQEAVAIADLVPPEWISVLNGIEAADIPLVRQLGAIPVLNTPKQIAMWRAAGGGACHVMIDTGINRLGIGLEQFSPELLEGLDIDIVMSHLASADQNSAQNARQLGLFNQLSRRIPAKRRSFANSAGIMLGADYHFDLTRPGIGLYGGIERAEMAGGIVPVLHVASRILQVRHLQAAEAVGYGATHVCDKPTVLATAAMGYADGYLRSFAGSGTAYAGETALPVIGRISMDLITIDASACPSLAEGDWVTLPYDLAALAVQSGLSQYELITGLGQRSKRIWT